MERDQVVKRGKMKFLFIKENHSNIILINKFLNLTKQILSGEHYLSDDIGIVGKKGELYPPKHIRTALNLNPKSNVRYKITPNGHLLVEKIVSIEDILKKKPIAKISCEEIEEVSERYQNLELEKFEEDSS